MDLKDGEVTGLVEYVRDLQEGEEYRDISLNGDFFWKTSKLRMSIVKKGEVFDCGYLKIKRLNHKRIVLISKPKVKSHFPEKTLLWKI